MPVTPEVLDEFEKRSLEETPSRYEEAVGEVLANLRQEVLYHGYLKPPQVAGRIGSRVKDKKSVEEKVDRELAKQKRSGATIDTIISLEDLERDIAGVRVILDYLDQVHAIKDYVRGIRAWHSKKTEDYIANPPTSGYRSIHINTRVKTNHYGFIWCEIQIRTMNQDSWAEKSHPLIYKRTDEEIARLPKELLTSMRVLSDILYAADELAVLFRDMIRKHI